VILSYNCVFVVVLPMNLTERFGDGVELQALEFVNALPIEWRLVSEGTPTTDWQSPMPERKTFPFHDLQGSSQRWNAGHSGRRYFARDSRHRRLHAPRVVARRNLPGEIKRHFNRHRLIDELNQ
jgi:hypothetical protein